MFTTKNVCRVVLQIYAHPGVTEHAYNPSIHAMETKGLRVQGHPGLHSPSLSPVEGDEGCSKSKLLIFCQEPLSPQLSFFWGGSKEGVTAPYPQSRRPLPSPHLALSCATFQSSCLFSHITWPQSPLLLLQDNLGLLFVPVNRDKQDLSSPGQRYF